MSEPISLAEVRRQVRLDDDTDDALLASLIVAAREHVEGITGLVLSRRQVTQTFDGFSGCLDLYAWPVESVETVTYRDAAWAEQTVAAEGIVLMSGGRPARLVAPAGWPRAATGRDVVSVTVLAGYLPGEVPQVLKAAMLLVLAGLYDTRAEMPGATEKAVRALCGQFKRWRV